MINRPVVRLIFTGLLALLNGSGYAATQPKFTIIPTTPTSLVLPVNGTSLAQYTVTNQTTETRVLAMVPIAGITQATTGIGDCANPFTLAPHQSCLLTLPLVGSQLSGNVVGGPEVCATNGPYDNTPDPYLCSQASKANSLNITPAPAELSVLTVTGSPLSLGINTPSTSASLTVTNHSTTVTALNIAANFNGTLLKNNVNQDASGCASVKPGEACTLLFTLKSGARTLPPLSFPISGSNTQSVNAVIRVVGLDISISSKTLQLDIDGTPQTVTVTNNSGQTASYISPKLGNLSGSVAQVTDVSCRSVLSSGTCTITFHSNGTTAVSSTPIVISGTNTKLVGMTIEVIAPLVAMIEIENPDLVIESPNSGSLFVKNTSAINATAIKADLGSSTLSTQVTQNFDDCADVVPGDTCELIFTPINGATAVDTTTVPVQGSNTSETFASITLNTPVQSQLVILSGSPLHLSVNGFGVMKLKNTSANNFVNVTADLASAGLSSVVQAYGCEDILAGAECDMTFTTVAGNKSIVPETAFNISGFVEATTTPTSTAQGEISVGTYYAYITDRTDGIFRCDVSPTTYAFSNCLNLNEGGINDVVGVIVDSSGQNLYVTDSTQQSFNQYKVDYLTGNLTFWSSTDIGGADTYYMAIDPNRQRIYVTHGSNSDRITNCDLNAEGIPHDCNNSYEFLKNSYGIAIDSTNNYAYVVGAYSDGANKVFRFTIGDDGGLDNRTQMTPDGNTREEYGIALNPIAAWAYLTFLDPITPNISSCQIFSGELVCVKDDIAMTGGTTGVAVNSAGTHAFIVGNAAGDQISLCLLNANYEVTTAGCTKTGGTFTTTQAYGIALWEGTS